MTRSAKAGWLVPAGLILLSLVPVLAGAFRVAELSAGPEVTPANARFVAAPVPVVLHIVGASLYCVLGAFQFAAGFRRRRPGWHRAAGRVLVPCGLVAAGSGLWMTLFYPHPPADNALLTGFRLVFGSAMAVSIGLGFAAIRRRDIARHRAWMARGYAIGMGAGTQAVILGGWLLVAGDMSPLTRALLSAVAWLLNLTIAEWTISRRRNESHRPGQVRVA
ncbi:DUF2306 domain-containing protein [Phytohabitans rumicis]|uniref:Membrane protein n=1 Tax=Phytohabitans rumicis TaxID=1076125 RepID=A0A6V8LMY8_9ACTN|nr:DUF2306 domain-containing protein [Phytohabitans rumicis]GFJ96371.1 membrane protein [Phytohabitans rumicis]